MVIKSPVISLNYPFNINDIRNYPAYFVIACIGFI